MQIWNDTSNLHKKNSSFTAYPQQGADHQQCQ